RAASSRVLGGRRIQGAEAERSMGEGEGEAAVSCGKLGSSRRSLALASPDLIPPRHMPKRGAGSQRLRRVRKRGADRPSTRRVTRSARRLRRNILHDRGPCKAPKGTRAFSGSRRERCALRSVGGG